MNANAKKWVAALRSDRFKQGKYALGRNDEDTRCPLGVGAELAVEAGVVERTLANDGTEHIFYGGFGLFLAPEIREWLGLATASGCFEPDNDLTNLNDKQNKTFAEIADIIESEPPGLFV